MVIQVIRNVGLLPLDRMLQTVLTMEDIAFLAGELNLIRRVMTISGTLWVLKLEDSVPNELKDIVFTKTLHWLLTFRLSLRKFKHI